jgi:hypothetical protein
LKKLIPKSCYRDDDASGIMGGAVIAAQLKRKVFYVERHLTRCLKQKCLKQKST